MPTPPSPLATAPRRSLLTRAVLDFSLLTLVVVGLLTLVAVTVTSQQLERRALSQTAALAAMGEDLVNRALDDARLRGGLLADEAVVSLALSGSNVESQLEEWLIDLEAEEQGVTGLAIFDEQGQRLAEVGQPISPLARVPEGSVVLPQITDRGWEWFDVAVPVADGDRRGTLVVRSETQVILRPLLTALPTLGQSAQLVLSAIRDDGQLVLMRPSLRAQDASAVAVGPAADALESGLAGALGVAGGEGLWEAGDERGERVLAAERSLPSLGWGLSVVVSQSEVHADTTRLVILLCASGALLSVLGLLLAQLLAGGLTQNLRLLTEKVRRLQPGQWDVAASIKSGDEVEVLDVVLSDIAGRLQSIYGRLEEEVQLRTRQALELYALDRAVLEGIDYGVATVDPQGLIRECNPGALRLLGLTRADVVGKPVAEVLVLQTKGMSLTGENHLVSECLASRKSVRARLSQRLSLIRRVGEPLPISLAVAPLLVQDTLNGAVAVFQDVTEERQVDALKSEFVALASHQLRTPISAIRWYLELIDDGTATLPADKVTYLKEMKGSIERTINLLNTLLQSAKLDEEGIAPHWASVDLSSLIRQLTTELSEMAARAGVDQTVSVPETALTITTDATLLSIALHNLLTNAIKYSRKDHGHVFVGVRATGDAIEITVRDDGIGIPAADQPRLFQKFFRASNVRTLDTDGNGLGLYITQSMLARLHGRVSLKSEVNVGTTVTVHLPVEPPAEQKTAGEDVIDDQS